MLPMDEPSLIKRGSTGYPGKKKKYIEILVLTTMYLPEVAARQMGRPFVATVGGAVVAIRLGGRAPACWSNKGPSNALLPFQNAVQDDLRAHN